MSCAKIDPALHQAQKPPWIKVRLPSNPVFFSTKALISDLRLHTVCESAQCPNRWECWSQGTATFMIAGDRCTRACGFCAVTTAKPFALEEDEPQRVAAAVCRMKLKHVVITAVAREVSHLAASSTARKSLVGRGCDQEWGHAWARGAGDRTLSDHGRFARGRLRSAHDGPVFTSDSEAFTGGRVHHARAIQLLRRHCAQKRLSPCRLWPAGPQFVSRGRLSSSHTAMTEVSATTVCPLRRGRAE